MKTFQLMEGAPPVSRIGLGGHYKAMEEGTFEERYALTDSAIAERMPLIRRAVEKGISWFDTTWRNEVVVLAETLKATGKRDDVSVNGMVLGAFSGSKAQGISVEDYFNRWLDARVAVVPGKRFDSFMINAIEEHYDAALCERLVRLLEQRRQAGDFRLFGFSCHNPRLAREIADRFPAFKVIMIPHNFRNRGVDLHFGDYTGPAMLIAMKTMVWAEYGIPFCTVNRLPHFAELFGFAPVADIATRALRFILRNSQPRTVVCSVNSPQELDELVAASDGTHSPEDLPLLEQYDRLQSVDGGLPVFLGALMTENVRENYFGLINMARVLGEKLPPLPLNLPDSPDRLRAAAAQLLSLLPGKGYARYLKGT